MRSNRNSRLEPMLQKLKANVSRAATIACKLHTVRPVPEPTTNLLDLFMKNKYSQKTTSFFD